MPSGDRCQDEEENASLAQSCAGRGVPVEQADTEAEPAGGVGGLSSRMVSGTGEDKEVDKRGEGQCMAEEGGGEPSVGEQGEEDMEMNGRHSSLANGSPGSTMGSGSTKR